MISQEGAGDQGADIEAAAARAVPQLCLVAAMDRNRAIGRDGDLPWRLPDDLRRFKALTSGGVVLMGRRTAESLGRALPNRRNLVLTSSGIAPFVGMTAVKSVEAAIAAAGEATSIFVCGGAKVYEALLPRATSMYLTHIDAAVEGADTWFPAWESEDWEIVWREQHESDERHFAKFRFANYVRRGKSDRDLSEI